MEMYLEIKSHENPGIKTLARVFQLLYNLIKKLCFIKVVNLFVCTYLLYNYLYGSTSPAQNVELVPGYCKGQY